jgi:hypothetical protein
MLREKQQQFTAGINNIIQKSVDEAVRPIENIDREALHFVVIQT